DPGFDDFNVRPSRPVDPAQRRQYIRAFDRRLLDARAHYIYTLQWHRIVPHRSSVRGWTITPSHYLNNQLDTVWLAEERRGPRPRAAPPAGLLFWGAPQAPPLGAAAPRPRLDRTAAGVLA